MKNNNYEEALVDEIPRVPKMCEYCGGDVNPVVNPEKPNYAKYHGVCQQCGAEYGLIYMGGGKTRMSYYINHCVWTYVGDGRKTMYSKRARELNEYWSTMGGRK